MTAKQAREELQFACEKAPGIFSMHGVKAIEFSQLWERFGERIEAHGMAYWPRVHVIVLSMSQK
jgi:hypothetical protein